LKQELHCVERRLDPAPHARAVVEQQPHRNRAILFRKHADLLLDAILQYAEVVPGERTDRPIQRGRIAASKSSYPAK
jgi:hypothetical protein